MLTGQAKRLITINHRTGNRLGFQSPLLVENGDLIVITFEWEEIFNDGLTCAHDGRAMSRY